MYRLFAHILRTRIKRMTGAETLEKLRNGIRRVRCLDDDLFTEARTIEIASRKSRLYDFLGHIAGQRYRRAVQLVVHSV